MASSRIRRYQDSKLQKQAFLAIAGSIAILVFLGLFGIKLLEGFSILLDKLHPSTTTNTSSQAIVLPPVLDPLPEATNSADLTISGKGQADLTAIVYADDTEYKKIKVEKDGSFTLPYTAQTDDKHTFSAKLTDDKGNLSDLSNIIFITVKRTKPTLEVTAPNDGTTVYGDPGSVVISGKTDPDNTVTVNDRFVLVKDDGSFSYTAALTQGDNSFHIVAKDIAGNIISLDRKVKYQK